MGDLVFNSFHLSDWHDACKDESPLGTWMIKVSRQYLQKYICFITHHNYKILPYYVLHISDIPYKQDLNTVPGNNTEICLEIYGLQFSGWQWRDLLTSIIEVTDDVDFNQTYCLYLPHPFPTVFIPIYVNYWCWVLLTFSMEVCKMYFMTMSWKGQSNLN